MALVRPDLVAVFIIAFVVAGVFYLGLNVGYPLLYIGLAALILGFIFLGYWGYRQLKG